MTKPLGSILSYYGAKRALASQIVPRFGAHASYYEVFAGSMAVLMAKTPSSTEVANDLYGALVTLARVLASDRAVELYDLVSRTLMHDALLREAKDMLASATGVPESVSSVSDEHLATAWAMLVTGWQGRNGTAGTRTASVAPAHRYTVGGGDPADRWRRVGESIPAWHQRLRGVTIMQRDAIELIDKIDDDDRTVIYADPPYLGPEGRRYIHKMSDDQHEALAAALGAKRKARVWLSYYDHPEVRRLYPEDRWRWIHLSAINASERSTKRGKRESKKLPEVLITSDMDEMLF